MTVESKRRVAFALLMGVVTTSIISLVLLAMNRGFSDGFLWAWLRSWVVGYILVAPAILLIGPRLQAKLNRLIK